MKYVIDPGRVSRIFEEINVGEFFLSENNAYLKIKPPREDNLHSALNIDTFELQSFVRNEIVYPVAQVSALLLRR